MLDVSKLRITLTNLPDYVPDPPLLGGLFYRGHLNIVASKPGMGKTWLMLGVARNVASEGMKTVIFNGEGGLPMLLNRCSALGFRVPDTLAVIFDSSTADFTLSTQSGWENFCQCCKNEEPDVVYIDSLLAFLGEDESNMKEMNNVMNRLRLLAQKYDCAVVINHHLRKGQGPKGLEEISLDDVIGSSVLARVACTVYCLVKQANGLTLKVDCLKSWFAKTPDCYFDVSKGDMFGCRILFRSMQKEDNSTKKRILDQMSENRDVRVTIEQLCKATHLNARTVRRVMKTLYESGHVDRQIVSNQPLTYNYGYVD